MPSSSGDWRSGRMGELLPTLAAQSIRDGLLEYLETTFALSDLPARLAMAEFLEHPDRGHLQGARTCGCGCRSAQRPKGGGRRLTGIRSTTVRASRRMAIRREAFARLSSAGLGPERASAADARDDRYRLGQDRGIPLPDPRPRPAREGARRDRDEGADPVPDECAGQRPGAAARRADHDASVARRRHRRPVHGPAGSGAHEGER